MFIISIVLNLPGSQLFLKVLFFVWRQPLIDTVHVVIDCLQYPANSVDWEFSTEVLIYKHTLFSVWEVFVVVVVSVVVVLILFQVIGVAQVINKDHGENVFTSEDEEVRRRHSREDVERKE